MADAVLSLEPFADPGLTEETLLSRLAWLKQIVGPRLERFMGYYRNPTTELSATLPCASSTSFAVRPFRQYQELGLPARIIPLAVCRFSNGLALQHLMLRCLYLLDELWTTVPQPSAAP